MIISTLGPNPYRRSFLDPGTYHIPGLNYITHRPPPKKRGQAILPFPTIGCTLGRVSWRAVKYISKLVGFTFTPLLESLILPVVQPPTRISLSYIFLNSSYLYSRQLNIPYPPFILHHPRQRMHNPSIDIFTFWVPSPIYPKKMTERLHHQNW